MRTTEDIRGDYQDVVTLAGSAQEREAATVNLVNDIPDLLDLLAEAVVIIGTLEERIEAGNVALALKNLRLEQAERRDAAKQDVPKEHSNDR